MDRRLSTRRRQGGGVLCLGHVGGRCYYLGTNKEVFDAETFAIYQALRALDQRQESKHRYTVFVDSASALDRVRSDALGPG